MMAAALWAVFAVATMIGIFAGCVIGVVVGIRLLENAREKRRLRKLA